MVKRSLQIITGLGYGGAESMFIRLLSSLKNHYAFKVVTLNKENPRAWELEKQGIPVEKLEITPHLPNPLKFLRLLKIIRKFQPNFVQTWMYHADLLGGVASRLVSKAPVIWSLRQSDFDPRQLKFHTRLTIKLCTWLSGYIPAQIVSCSHAGKLVHAEKGYPADKITVIPNAYDLDTLASDLEKREKIRRELNLSAADFLIGYVARFAPKKDHKNFIKAAEILAKKEGRVKFLLCGPDINWENSKLTGWIEKAGLAERVFLLGEREDIVAINCGLDLATIASAYGEGFPNVVAEAMATETPCVVTDVGDAARMLGDMGAVIPPDAPDKLATAWRKFIQMEPAQLQAEGRQARRRIAENYSLDKVVSQFDSLYRKLI